MGGGVSEGVSVAVASGVGVCVGIAVAINGKDSGAEQAERTRKMHIKDIQILLDIFCLYRRLEIVSMF